MMQQLFRKKTAQKAEPKTATPPISSALARDQRSEAKLAVSPNKGIIPEEHESTFTPTEM